MRSWKKMSDTLLNLETFKMRWTWSLGGCRTNLTDFSPWIQNAIITEHEGSKLFIWEACFPELGLICVDTPKIIWYLQSDERFQLSAALTITGKLMWGGVSWMRQKSLRGYSLNERLLKWKRRPNALHTVGICSAYTRISHTGHRSWGWCH